MFTQDIRKLQKKIMKGKKLSRTIFIYIFNVSNFEIMIQFKLGTRSWGRKQFVNQEKDFMPEKKTPERYFENICKCFIILIFIFIF